MPPYYRVSGTALRLAFGIPTVLAIIGIALGITGSIALDKILNYNKYMLECGTFEANQCVENVLVNGVCNTVQKMTSQCHNDYQCISVNNASNSYCNLDTCSCDYKPVVCQNNSDCGVIDYNQCLVNTCEQGICTLKQVDNTTCYTSAQCQLLMNSSLTTCDLSTCMCVNLPAPPSSEWIPLPMNYSMVTSFTVDEGESYHVYKIDGDYAQVIGYLDTQLVSTSAGLNIPLLVPNTIFVMDGSEFFYGSGTVNLISYQVGLNILSDVQTGIFSFVSSGSTVIGIDIFDNNGARNGTTSTHYYIEYDFISKIL